VHPSCKDFDSIQAGLSFARGEAAMMVNWFGFATMAHTSPDSAIRGLVDIAEIPSDRGHSTTSLNVYWILSIAAGSPYPGVAWRFLQHCLTPAMDKLTTTSGAIGCRKSTWTDPEVNAAIPFYHRMESLHAAAREIPQRSDWPGIAAIIDKLVVSTITADQSVETLLQQAENQVLSLAL
jgi:multiple sugar transport system substrate-binding protein